jgi:hypothetical protein
MNRVGKNEQKKERKVRRKERSGKKGILRKGEQERSRKKIGKSRKWTKEKPGFRKKEKHVRLTVERRKKE